MQTSTPATKQQTPTRADVERLLRASDDAARALLYGGGSVEAADAAAAAAEAAVEALCSEGR